VALLRSNSMSPSQYGSNSTALGSIPYRRSISDAGRSSPGSTIHGIVSLSGSPFSAEALPGTSSASAPDAKQTKFSRMRTSYGGVPNVHIPTMAV
jgi:hypothetical protein